MLKLFIAGTAMFFFTLISGTVGGTAYLVSGGVATVSVDTEDVDLWIPVPTRLLDMGLNMAATGVPDEDLRAMRHELARDFGEVEVGVVARELLDEVTDMPSGTLVEVQSEDGDVWIGKRRGRFLVRVDSPDGRIKVSIPARSADRVGDKVLQFAGL